MTTTEWEPVSGAVLPRYAGVPTFMRLPYIPEGDPRRAEVDIGILGMPWDGATSNRPGRGTGHGGCAMPRPWSARCTGRRGRRPTRRCNAPTWATSR
jgi:hypothetical protein